MQSTLATLLLVTSCVALTCVVVDYAAVTMEQTLQPANLPQTDRIQNLENAMLNETSRMFNPSYFANQTVLQPQTTLPP